MEMPEFEAPVFHVFGVDGLDLDRLWEVARECCDEPEGAGASIVLFEQDSEEKGCRQFDVLLRGESTQGVSVSYFAAEKGSHIHLALHEFASIGDVKLAFGLMRALRKLFPECEIYYKDTYEQGQFRLAEENYDAMVTLCLSNLIKMLESLKEDQFVGLPGYYRPCFAPSAAARQEVDIAEFAMCVMDNFIALQWNYANMHEAGKANITSPSGEEYTACFLVNQADTFVPMSDHVCLSWGENEVRDVLREEFIEKMESHPCFHWVDQVQFVLEKMSAKKWKQVCLSFPKLPDPLPSSLTLAVTLEQFNEILSGKKRYVDVDIRKDNFKQVLENVAGNLLLVTDELPDTFFGCHFWNEGAFPYTINKNLNEIVLTNQSRQLQLNITGHSESVKERGDYLPDGSFEPNPAGEACLWTVRFQVEIEAMGGIPREPDDDFALQRPTNCFLLRWNPAISSMTLDAYHNGIEQNWEGRVFDWSIFDWKKAHMGDRFFMLREGDDDGAGIVFAGELASEPYIDEDWRGTENPRHYCLFSIDGDPSPMDGPAHVSIGELEDALPEIDWRKGHSGERLTPMQADRLIDLYYHVDDDEFDPDQGHGGHNQCIDENLEVFLLEMEDVLAKCKTTIAEVEVEANDEEGEAYDAELVLFSSDESKDLTMRCIVEKIYDQDYVLKSAFPYVPNQTPVAMTLRRIDEYSNGIEAVLTCELCGQEFSFFDVDYPLHKAEYELGGTYDFALSAIAYKAGAVPQAEMYMDFDLPVEVREAMGAPKEEVIPMYMGELVACLQSSRRYPDDAVFWTQTQSKARKVSFLHRDFYRMEIMLFHDEDDNSLNIPLIVKASMFETKPAKGTSIRGHYWLQGRRV